MMSALELLQILKNENISLLVLKTKHNFNGLRASLAVYTNALVDGQVWRFFFHLFSNQNFMSFRSTVRGYCS